MPESYSQTSVKNAPETPPAVLHEGDTTPVVPIGPAADITDLETLVLYMKATGYLT